MMTSMAISDGDSDDNNYGDGEDDDEGKDDDCGSGGVPAQKTTINQMRQQKKWQW